jgi:hypothetical protein
LQEPFSYSLFYLFFLISFHGFHQTQSFSPDILVHLVTQIAANLRGGWQEHAGSQPIICLLGASGTFSMRLPSADMHPFVSDSRTLIVSGILTSETLFHN